ncbi:MAG: sugar isomerase, partial [Gemmobacter sp.]|nr:sugar isomerase [Gemmobacter sp.]
DPFRLFLVWNELVELEETPGLDLSHMIDQSHNVTDPIESLMISAMEIERAYVQASLVDRAALAGYREGNDALMAAATLRQGFRTDVEPILAMARLRKGGAIDPVAAYRASGYRARVAAVRPRSAAGGGGIV